MDLPMELQTTMIAQLLRRKEDVEKGFGETIELLSDLENRMMTANNPIELKRLKQDIENTKENYKYFLKECKAVLAALQEFQSELNKILEVRIIIPNAGLENQNLQLENPEN